jgi:GT2 family glycosyltransferase
MSEPGPVGVVIPSWNSAGLLPSCLGSIAAQGVATEVVVVDNGSTDGSRDLLRERGVECVGLPENRGFSVAVDLGVERLASEAVLILNADTELEPGCLAALTAALAADRGLAAVAPRILQLEAERRVVAAARLYSIGQGLTADGRAVEIGAGEAQGEASARGREVFGVCGAACLWRREAFAAMGGYERSYFAFYEDVDLNVRAQIAGWRFEYVPEAVVWHLGNASWQAGAPRPGAWNARLVARNRLLTQAKFMPAAALPRIAAVEVGALARAARQGRFGATARGKLEGLRRLPWALRERRRLAAAGDLSRPRVWLSRGADGAVPAPRGR